jgi:threonine aldolase
MNSASSCASDKPLKRCAADASNFVLNDAMCVSTEPSGDCARFAPNMPLPAPLRRGYHAAGQVPRAPSSVIDLRSDTVTKPSQRMRDAMRSAAVGDDVMGEDPSVLALEEKSAKLTGKEAAMFICSGTMSNLSAFLAHCDRRGSEIICGHRQHTHLHEQGGVATLGGIHTRTVPNQEDGTLDIGAVLDCIRADDVHYCRAVVVSVENTHNDCGGKPLDLDYLDALRRALQHTRQGRVQLHMDGARVGNAAVATGQSLERTCRAADSVSICLSKGMGAPVGSVLVGSRELIARARRARKALGGGWRQAGVLAACGLIALDTFPETLARDHRLAKLLAEGLRRVPGIVVPEMPATNMVYFEPAAHIEPGFAERMTEQGILAFGGRGANKLRVRAVIHCDVHEQDVDQVVERMKKIV